MVKYCKNCGSELADGSVFCDECGTKAGESAPRGGPSNDVFSSYKIDMMDGEEVIRHSQIHEGCLILPCIVLGIGIIIGMISFISIARYGYLFGIWGFFNGFTIAGIIWLIIRFIGYKTNDLILTNKRVFGKSGLISTTQMQSSLKKIDSVSYKNGLIGKLIGYGTVQVATTSSKYRFRFIRDGQSLYNDIFNQLEISESEKIKQNAKAIADEIKE